MNPKEMKEDLIKIKDVIEQSDHDDKEKLSATIDAQIKVLEMLQAKTML